MTVIVFFALTFFTRRQRANSFRRKNPERDRPFWMPLFSERGEFSPQLGDLLASSSLAREEPMQPVAAGAPTLAALSAAAAPDPAAKELRRLLCFFVNLSNFRRISKVQASNHSGLFARSFRPSLEERAKLRESVCIWSFGGARTAAWLPRRAVQRTTLRIELRGGNSIRSQMRSRLYWLTPGLVSRKCCALL